MHLKEPQVNYGPQQQHLSQTATTTLLSTKFGPNQSYDCHGVSAALAARDATRNGTDSHSSGYGSLSGIDTRCSRNGDCLPNKQLLGGEPGQKFSTCTLLASALTWWNSHVMTVTHDVAYSMTWVDLRKKMINKYYPRNKIKKLEAELWNLKVIGIDVVKYNQRFQELALLCIRMFPEESDKIERYVGGLPDMIYGNIVASSKDHAKEAIEWPLN
ncbi:reverse transcriptase domain-containing protein [Tanacetum coccineum]